MVTGFEGRLFVSPKDRLSWQKKWSGKCSAKTLLLLKVAASRIKIDPLGMEVVNPETRNYASSCDERIVVGLKFGQELVFI